MFRLGRAVQHGGLALRLFPAAAVLFAIWRATTDCVGGAAINLARSESTVLDTDAACFSKRGAAFRGAHFLVGPAMLAARSFRCRSGGSAAAINLARSVRTVLAADATC